MFNHFISFTHPLLTPGGEVNSFSPVKGTKRVGLRKRDKLKSNNGYEERLPAGRQEHGHVIEHWKGGD
jgi:hypothetical protein